MELFRSHVLICGGTGCTSSGSVDLLHRFQELVKEKHYEDKVELAGAFCMKNCVNGVCVTVDGKLFSVKPETADEFFEAEIASKLS